MIGKISTSLSVQEKELKKESKKSKELEESNESKESTDSKDYVATPDQLDDVPTQMEKHDGNTAGGKDQVNTSVILSSYDHHEHNRHHR